MDSKILKYMPIAQAISLLSKDPSTKVGAIALDHQYNIVATGYNGFPRGVADALDRYEDRDIKYRLISHAEQNLVAQAAYSGRSLAGTTVLISSLFPCTGCAKSLIQAGVKRIVSPAWDSNERWLEETKWAKILLDEASVEIINVEDLNRPGR
jgi:dCMP deaminase